MKKERKKLKEIRTTGKKNGRPNPKHKKKRPKERKKKYSLRE